jgi:RNA polymerase sigma-70 factor (ECF subfamily)
MKEVELKVKEIIDNYSFLIKRIIKNNLYAKDNIYLEDIEQEVKLKIWNVFKKGKKVNNLASYIKKVAYTVTVDELRKMRRQDSSRNLDRLKDIYAMTKSFFTEETDNYREDFIIIVREAIDSLIENRKQVLRLYFRGMSVEEICKLFNWDKTRVKHLLYRGIKDLKDKIKNDGSGTQDELNNGKNGK